MEWNLYLNSKVATTQQSVNYGFTLKVAMLTTDELLRFQHLRRRYGSKLSARLLTSSLGGILREYLSYLASLDLSLMYQPVDHGAVNSRHRCSSCE